jgi:hypothetical protein
MTAVTIHKEHASTDKRRFRAIAGKNESFGRTAGEALDNLNAKYGDSGALVVVQQMQSDTFFSEEQFLRMRDLLDLSEGLSEPERNELEELVNAELVASARRVEVLADALGR